MMRVQVAPYLVLAALAAGGGGWLAWKLKPEPKVPAVVHLDPAVMEASRVTPKPGLLERVELGRVKPTQTRIATAPSVEGKAAVDSYCAPSVAAASNPSAVPDSAKKRGTGPAPILPDFGGRAGSGRLTLQSTLNNDRRWEQDYKVHGRWTWVSSGDSVIVRSERLWLRLGRGLLQCGVIAGAYGGIGFLADRQQPLQGALRGAVIGGGTCAAVKLAF